VKANSGEEALRHLLNQDFVLILLDVQMPGMDGFETAELIRKRERSRYTPIIFLSVQHKRQSGVQRLFLGAVDYLFADFRNIDIEGRGCDLFKKTEEVKRQAVQIKMQELQVLSQQHEKLIALGYAGRWTCP